ncbi:YadA family autotransporter adhesin [Burkholderia sp. GbtcB21]|uniref:YadA family autotransporter adhesin n=1 Tax=Burkholderia sp. GbtcB21 TaxID=2824766 RepID=UPI0020C5FE5E|nr:ESPR-type extended signal peptide-containing protein [Burkholderia sp. GbtcB21]
MRSSSRPVGFTPPHAATSAPACRTGPTQTARRFSPGRQIRTRPILTILSVAQHTERSREMNKTYRNIWNAATGTWTAVAETAKSHSKGSARVARQAVVALALGGASMGSVFAADACTTEDGRTGSLDVTGACTPASATGMMSTRSIGTNAVLDDALIKVNGSTDATATSSNSIAIGSGAIAGAGGTTTTNQVAIGALANAQGLSSTALGSSSTANGTGAVALGRLSNATGNSATALGNQSSAQAAGSTALGNGASVAAGATNSVAIGNNASVAQSVTNSMALGTDATATRNNTIAVGSATQQRQITNMAAGTQATDAVNLGQMNAALAPKLDDTYVKIDTTSSTAPAQAGNTGVAVGANAQGTGTGATAIGGNTIANNTNTTALGRSATASGVSSSAVGTWSRATGAESSAIGTNATASGSGSVALGVSSIANRDNSVSVGNATLQRQITNMAAGTQATDAVNVSQLTPVVDALGGGAAIDPTTGAVTGPTYVLTNGGTQTTVGDALGALDGELTTAKGDIAKNTTDITNINNQLGDLSSGTIGIVQQAGAGADITVGAATDGAAVNFAGTAGDRKLAGVAAGEVSATSNEAVNGSQLHGVSESVASAIGAGSTVNPDGSITAPSFTVGDGNGGTTIVRNVGDAVSNLDGRVTTNEGDIANLADQIGSGTVGLVQQDGTTRNITVAKNTDGTVVDFTGTAGDRKLAGVAAGEVSATSNEAVNGSQLHGVSESVASAIGAGSTVNPDGSITAPSFTVGDGNGGTTIVHNVGDAVSNLDGRVTNNEGAITNLGDQLAAGQIGLVRQDQATGAITVGAATGGSTVNFAGTNGARTLSGVGNGVNDDDAVTIAQLKATGLIDYTGKEIAAVTYDDITLGSVTFGGVGGTALHNVAPGLIAANSMDAVNGSQLYDMQQQFAQQFGQLSGQMNDLTDRVGELETGSGGGSGGGMGPGTGTGGDGSLVVGDGADASGENSTAVGQGAVASGDNGSAFGQGSAATGDNGTAIGQGSAASGDNGTAIGQGSAASGENSTAIGQGSSASGSGSVAIGAGSIADEANTVSFGNGTEEGNRRIVNIADGVNASDAATKGQLDRAMESVDQRFGETNRMINDVAKNAYAGVAAAMAMPNLTPSQPGKTVVAVGAANYKSGSAVAAGATYRTRDGKWLMNGALSVTSTGDAGVRAQVGYEF